LSDIGQPCSAELPAGVHVKIDVLFQRLSVHAAASTWPASWPRSGPFRPQEAITMKRKKRRTSMPVLLCWTKRDQLRFIDAVERFQSLVNDLETILAAAKRKRAAKTSPATSSNGGAT
jgi:hypothetical protein